MSTPVTRDMRTHLADVVSSILLGPLRPDEELRSAPVDTYLTGVLWPRDQELLPAEDDGDLGTSEGDDSPVDRPVPGYRSIKPCSIGLTFSVRSGIPVKISLEGSACYVREDPHHDTPAGSERVRESGSSDGAPWRWLRQSIDLSFVIAPDEQRQTWRETRVIGPEGPEVALDIRHRVHGDLKIVTASLLNVTPPERRLGVPSVPIDSHCLFQAGLTVLAVDEKGRGGILPRDRVVVANDDEDAATNALLYRESREFAVGHGVAADWDGPVAGTVSWVATTWLPRSTVKGTSTAGHPLLAAFAGRKPSPLSARELAKPEERIRIIGSLRDFCSVYGEWISAELEARLATFTGELKEPAARHVRNCRQALARMEDGVDTLEANDPAWEAFTLANEAMDTQSRFVARGQEARPLFWRPFQLAFLLLVIPSIVNPARPDRRTMDLLWFPTGGGKTEAYLGLSAFTIFLRRLTSATRRDQGGVDVLMRYTLRLLTIQQFQRAAALMAACDSLRAARSDRLGAAAISIGLYVGGDSTPNRLQDAAERILEERRGGAPPSTPRQLLACPICGETLPASAYEILPDAGRMRVICPRAGCAGQHGLPVLTVDEAIYRSPPSLLIGTVDKFAQLPRRTDLRVLFGLGTPERPALIIQDELHLISGPLGSIAGLYEAAIDRLCTVGNSPPKVVGSTATIGRAVRQVRALFDRDVMQFPPPGFDAGDSFFAVRDDGPSDRLYLGLSSAGRSPKFALQAALGAVLQGASYLRADGSSDSLLDPYWTCVAYFNSLRELGGAIVMMLDDVPRTMRVTARRLGCPERPLEQLPTELSGRHKSNEIPATLRDLNFRLDGDPREGSPVDAVLASNMISVGVDIPRLGLMVVNGVPKSTAEYIQATSRVGRGQPGLVLTLHNSGRPRDTAHFEHFRAYHQALYRAVEATSVTPWASRARDKTLHATLVTLIRHLVEGMAADEAAVRFRADDPVVVEVVDFLCRRADPLERAETAEHIHWLLAEWARRADGQRGAGEKLSYWAATAAVRGGPPHLMRDAEQVKAGDSQAWATPNSMREIEPSTVFVLAKSS